MNLYEMLHQDHEKARGLFAQLEAVGDEDDIRREQIFLSLYRELDLHARAEEKFLYAQLKNEEGLGELIGKAVEDHEAIKRLLHELEAMDKAASEWAGRLATLQEAVEHHVQTEEGEIFPAARKVFAEDEAAGLAEDLDAFKEEHEQLESY